MSATPADPGTATPATPSFPALDTLRGIAATAVLTTHVAFWAGAYTRHGVGGTLLARLDVGVAVFFVLSGFLLSYPFLSRARDGRPRPATGRYLWKRLVRIYPVYALTVVVALVLVPENAGSSATSWLTTLTMADVFVHPRLPYGLTQTWSLSVEATFYLALPLLMLVATGRRRGLRPRRVLLLLAVLTVLDVLWHLRWAGAADVWSPGSPLQWLPAYLTWFSVGIALALAHVVRDGTGRRGGRTGHALVTLARQPGSCWAMAAAVMLLAATPLAGPTMLAAPSPAQALTKSLLYAVVAGLVVLPAVFLPRDGLFVQLVGTRVLRHLGRISYPVFCLHLPLLQLVMWVTGYRLFGGHLVPIWLLTVAVSLVCAEVVHRYLEVPALRLKGLGRGTRPEPASATAPTSGTSIT